MSNSANKLAQVFVVGAKRTAFGAYGGALKNHSAAELATIASRAALRDAGIKVDDVDHVIMGNVMHTSPDGPYLSRHVALRVGLPTTTPAYNVNRLCGSGFQSIVDGSRQIMVGDSKVVLTGGTENMSQAPFMVRGTRFGTQMGQRMEFECMLQNTSFDSYVKMQMGMTAEKLASIYKLKRKEVDEIALRSQLRWREAQNSGFFKNEIEPFKVRGKKGAEIDFDTDEHPRDTTEQQLSALKPVFKQEGLVTAGNASGICDGAAALVLASEASLTKLNLKPLVRMVAWHAVGCEPSVMGIGPVDAIKGVLYKTNLSMEDIDLFEVNEAFAAQLLAVKNDLKIDDEKLNVNGGAIAMGHPLGASGARIAAHLAHEMNRRNVRFGIGSACVGGGQGMAVLFEKI